MVGHHGIDAGSDLKLGLSRPDRLEQVREGDVHDLGCPPHALQLRLGLDRAHAVDDPVAVDHARAERAQPFGGHADERRTGCLRPPLDPDAALAPAALTEGRHDRVERVLVAVEDRVVVEHRVPDERLVALVVEEDEAFVVLREDDAQRGARWVPDRLEPGQVAEVRRAHDEQHVDVPARHLLAHATGAVAVLGLRERQLARQRRPQALCSAHTASMSSVA